jgi:hypothetical protein
MNQQETISAITQLLQCLPAVWVDSSVPFGEIGAYFTIKVLDFQSLALIKWCCDGANVKNTIQFESLSKPHQKLEGNDLRLHISVPGEKDASEPPTTLEMFGINLVWVLKPRGYISNENAEYLLKAWHV